MLGHRLGAGLAVMLAALCGRALARRAPHQPLGEALPVIFITGSLGLLGHAHQGLAGTAHLDTLIGVQHTLIGALGVFAGLVRWLQLRGIRPRVTGLVWPSLIIALGAIMAFWYHEMI